MTDPTPTRAEVEAARFAPYSDAPSGDGWMDYHPHGEWVRLADYQALRERAEADERGQTALRSMLRQAETALTAARRAEAAAWNDAIEAGWAYIETCLDEPETDADAALISDMEEGFRALRRAAPTEGEA